MKACKGLLGLIFGHKFVTTKGGYIYDADYCYRCGYTPKSDR